MYVYKSPLGCACFHGISAAASEIWQLPATIATPQQAAVAAHAGTNYCGGNWTGITCTNASVTDAVKRRASLAAVTGLNVTALEVIGANLQFQEAIAAKKW
jgi:hypothetical protein